MRPDFDLLPLEHQRSLQPDAPVQLCCSRRCRERHSGAVFVQVRLLNRSDRPIRSVYLRLEGLDALGQQCFSLDEVVLADLSVPGHSLCGEERMLALPCECSSLRVLVRRVVFGDGNHWSCPGAPVLADPAELSWTQCVCGCWNGPEAEHCALCRKALHPEEPEAPKPQTDVRPGPIRRTQSLVSTNVRTARFPVWAILLISFGIVTMLAALALFASFHF